MTAVRKWSDVGREVVSIDVWPVRFLLRQAMLCVKVNSGGRVGRELRGSSAGWTVCLPGREACEELCHSELCGGGIMSSPIWGSSR